MALIAKLDNTGNLTTSSGVRIDEWGFDATSLLGWWKLDGLNDLSGTSKILTNNGAVLQTTNRFGTANSAYLFNNDSTDYLSTALSTTITTYTVGIWFKITTGGVAQTIFSYCPSATNKIISLNINAANTLGASIPQGAASTFWSFLSGSVVDSIWRHFVVTVTGTTVVAYLNGATISNDTSVGAANGNTLQNNILIGRRHVVATPLPLIGAVSDCKFFTRVLSAAEVKKLYLHEKGQYFPTTTSLCGLKFDEWGFDSTSLIGWWKLDGLNDLSGNSRTLTNSGAALTTNRFGTANSAYTFVLSESDYIYRTLTTSIDLIANWTFSCWIKTSQIDTSVYFSLSGSTIQRRCVVGKAVGVGIFVCINDGTTPTTYTFPNTVNIWDNTWHHIAAGNSSGIPFAYCDGVSITPPISTGNTNANVVDVIRLGRNNTGTPSYYNGSLSDAKLWNRTLSAAEIKRLYLHERGNFGTSGNLTTPTAPDGTVLNIIETA